MDLGGEESLVGVDVTEAADDGLVEDDGLDGGFGVAMEGLVEGDGIHSPRLGGEFLDEGVGGDLSGREDFNKAEFALVVEVEGALGE